MPQPMIYRGEGFTSNKRTLLGAQHDSVSSQPDLKSLSSNRASSLRKEKDNEIMELHNRIKKLILEEERTTKKIAETRRKA
jgi:hypothetical protein